MQKSVKIYASGTVVCWRGQALDFEVFVVCYVYNIQSQIAICVYVIYVTR